MSPDSHLSPDHAELLRRLEAFLLIAQRTKS
ncbi:MAG: hypothetical protein JWN57_2719 [Frankiales bacterium]|jgi:hypothetical protein|nr:hypothetical protein [Frankiales bacterium]